MKYKIITIATLLIFLAVACSTHKKVTLYDFPPTMGDEVKAAYVAQFEKGKILYDISCAKCHTTKKRGKEIIPDFTSQQLINYEIRILNPDHTESIPEMQVAEDELAIILTFLRYKRKN